MARREKYDASKLKRGQREAAFLLMEYAFGESKYQNKTEIAEAVGVTRQTLYNWETKDQNFIALLNDLTETFMESRRSEVYAHLLKKVRQGSTRGIELYLKNRGLLQEKVEHTHIEEAGDLTERQKRLEERLKKLYAEEENAASQDNNE